MASRSSPAGHRCCPRSAPRVSNPSWSAPVPT
ncbi:Uncharacterised protein [Bordetella pertussis]|nr:Uncharacterised protein [Bordetella pertussis]